MKKILFIIFLSINTIAFSQTILNSSGGELKGTKKSLSYSIGEISTATIYGNSEAITQGFLQPLIHVSIIANKFFDTSFTVNCFPNPFAQNLQIQTNYPSFTSFEISDLSGKKILRDLYTHNTINLQALPLGVFFIQLIDDNNLTYSKIIKIVKQ